MKLPVMVFSIRVFCSVLWTCYIPIINLTLCFKKLSSFFPLQSLFSYPRSLKIVRKSYLWFCNIWVEGQDRIWSVELANLTSLLLIEFHYPFSDTCTHKNKRWESMHPSSSLSVWNIKLREESQNLLTQKCTILVLKEFMF